MSEDSQLTEAVRSFQQAARRWNGIVQGASVALGGFVAPLIMWQMGVGGKEFWAYPLPLLLVVGGIFFSERIALALVKRRFSSDETYSDIFRYGNHRLIQMDTASAVAAVEQAKTANS